jgi:hypothetical protein
MDLAVVFLALIDWTLAIVSVIVLGGGFVTSRSANKNSEGAFLGGRHILW